MLRYPSLLAVVKSHTRLLDPKRECVQDNHDVTVVRRSDVEQLTVLSAHVRTGQDTGSHTMDRLCSRECPTSQCLLKYRQ